MSCSHRNVSSGNFFETLVLVRSKQNQFVFRGISQFSQSNKFGGRSVEEFYNAVINHSNFVTCRNRNMGYTYYTVLLTFHYQIFMNPRCRLTPVAPTVLRKMAAPGLKRPWQKWTVPYHTIRPPMQFRTISAL